MLNAAQGDLAPLFEFDEDTTRDLLQQRQSSAIQERRSNQEARRRGLSSDPGSQEVRQSTTDDGENPA
jgi:hypothetical protein